MMTCVDARHLSDDSRQRTPRWSLTPVRQASLINLPGRGSLRSGIFRRQRRPEPEELLPALQKLRAAA
jgi:hypothetical protein